VALPTATVLNVNTASPEILAAAFPGISTDALAALVAERARKPFATLSDLRSRMPAGVNIPDETTLGTSSSFFLVSVRARQGETRAQARALLRRNGREWPIVVWQTIE
jgi:general secretion pathway protein K